MKENKQKHYLIYQTTNLVNGKIYIGKHETFNIEDNYFGSGNLIQAAIKKYGLENFEFKILIDLKSKEEMNLLEKMVVTEEFCKREDVYNIKIGGEGGWDEVNRRGRNIGWSYANKTGLNNKNGQCFITAKKMKEDPVFAKKVKKTISNRLKAFYANHPERIRKGKDNPMFGKHLSKEACQRISQANSGKRNPMSSRMWIRNPVTKEFKVWMKDSPIPNGWERGKYQPKK